MSHFTDILFPDPRLPKGVIDLSLAWRAINILREQILHGDRDQYERKEDLQLFGLDRLVDRVLHAVILGEHILLEGDPGLGKTFVIRLACSMMGLVYRRVQFVPDLLPSDLLKKQILVSRGDRARIDAVPGPIFTNLLLADELNRASPKSQAALLEACEEGQVTVLGEPTQVVRPIQPVSERAILKRFGPYFEMEAADPEKRKVQTFTVLATQNPIELEGVYMPSKAQLDRFLYKIELTYPRREDYKLIARHAFLRQEDPRDKKHGRTEGGHDGHAREDRASEGHARALYFFAWLKENILNEAAYGWWRAPGQTELREKVEWLILLTHLRRARSSEGGFAAAPLPLAAAEARRRVDEEAAKARQKGDARLQKRWETLEDLLDDSSAYPPVLRGSSPRGLLKLIRAAFVRAFVEERFGTRPDYRGVAPRWEDFVAMAPDVLRHRIQLAPEAEASGRKAEEVVHCLTTWMERNW